MISFIQRCVMCAIIMAIMRYNDASSFSVGVFSISFMLVNIYVTARSIGRSIGNIFGRFTGR